MSSHQVDSARINARTAISRASNSHMYCACKYFNGSEWMGMSAYLLMSKLSQWKASRAAKRSVVNGRRQSTMRATSFGSSSASNASESDGPQHTWLLLLPLEDVLWLWVRAGDMGMADSEVGAAGARRMEPERERCMCTRIRGITKTVYLNNEGISKRLMQEKKTKIIQF